MSTETPAVEFERLCAEVLSSDNDYYGRAQVGGLEQYLARSDVSPDNAARGRGLLATHYLRLGEIDGALRLLGEAERLTREHQLDRNLWLALLRDIGLANLRLGETLNCIDMHGPAMCIYPVLDGGTHRDPGAALRSVDAYRTYLRAVPEDAAVRWLLNIAAMVAGGYPEAVPEPLRVKRSLATTNLPRFLDVAPHYGIEIIDSSGGGLMEDLDLDGRLDVITSSAEPCTPMRFFRGGAGRATAAAGPAGLQAQLGGLNVIHADYDDDGFVDLFVLRGGWLGEQGYQRNSLLRNNGDGTFDDVSRAAGVAFPACPTQTGAFADYDGDGDLDLFVGCESPAEDPRQGPLAASQLYRNNGDGTFTDVARRAGVRNDRFAKAAAWGDVDDDGDPDLFVSNIGRNRLYRNDGDGTFTDIAPLTGTVEPAGRSFTSWFFDHDNDGRLDLFVGNYAASTDDIAAWLLGDRDASEHHPSLFVNGPEGLRDRAAELGLDAPSLPMGGNFGDLDNDGWLDFYLGTGLPSYESLMPNLMYRNVEGEGFEDVTAPGGFGHLQKGHGVAFGDWDGDGDQDVFEQLGGAYPGDAYPSALYENPGNDNGWVVLRLVGRAANRSALGARVDLWASGPSGTRRIHRQVGTGGSFGGNPLQLEVGLGDAVQIDRVLIRWPGSGGVTELRGVPPRRIHRVREGIGLVE